MAETDARDPNGTRRHAMSQVRRSALYSASEGYVTQLPAIATTAGGTILLVDAVRDFGLMHVHLRRRLKEVSVVSD